MAPDSEERSTQAWPRLPPVAMVAEAPPASWFPASRDRNWACPETAAAVLWRCRRQEATNPDWAGLAVALESAMAMGPAAGFPAPAQERGKKAPGPGPIPRLVAEFLLTPAPAVPAPEPMATRRWPGFR